MQPHTVLEFLTHPLDKSVSVLMVVGGIFLFFFFDGTLYKQSVDTLVRRRVLWHLIWVCMLRLCPIKRTLVLKGY